MKKIFVTEPYIPNRANLGKYMDRALDIKRLTNDGPLLNELTEKLSEYLAVDNLLLVANGTAAISLAVKLLNIKSNVLTTPFSWVASASAPMWEGVPVSFSDISVYDYNIDPDLLQNKIKNQDIGAILPVHVFGCPAEVEVIDSIASLAGIPVIYDAAHAFGVKQNGKSILSYGDISTLSLHSTKIFHTVEGGALSFKDSNALDEAKKMINFGLNNGVFERIGINYKLSEIHAAMGLAILDEIDEIFERKKEIYEYYKEHLDGNIVFQKINDKADWNYSYCPILVESEKKAVNLLNALEKESIMARRYFYPSLNSLNFISDDSRCSISEDISSRILCLPSYIGLELSDLDRVIKIVLREC